MGIEALYRRPRTTKPEPGHKIYPYLLRGAAITRPNQVWAMDITYIPMARGFVYLVPGHGVKRSGPTYGPDPDLNLIQIPPADHSRIERGTCTYPAAA